MHFSKTANIDPNQKVQVIENWRSDVLNTDIDSEECSQSNVKNIGRQESYDAITMKFRLFKKMEWTET